MPNQIGPVFPQRSHAGLNPDQNFVVLLPEVDWECILGPSVNVAMVVLRNVTHAMTGEKIGRPPDAGDKAQVLSKNNLAITEERPGRRKKRRLVGVAAGL
jgi:hypothetical protein